MPVKRLRGATIAYDDHGRGAPLLFLHGIYVSRSQWWKQVTALAPSYRVITCDLRGHGGSSDTPDDVTVATLADDIAALIEHLELEPVVCCGHSFGGLVAQELALRHPSRVKGLILAETLYGIASTPFEAGLTAAWSTAFAWLGPRPLMDSLAMYFGMLSPGGTPRITRDAARHLGDEDNAIRILQASLKYDSRWRLQDISCPTLVVVGGIPMIPLVAFQALEMCSRIGRAELTVVPCAGHMVHWDNAPAFNSAVNRFMDGLN